MFSTITIAAAMAAADVVAQQPRKAVTVGQPAPSFSAQSLAGRTINLPSLHGKVVVLDFWTTT